MVREGEVDQARSDFRFWARRRRMELERLMDSGVGRKT